MSTPKLIGMVFFLISGAVGAVMFFLSLRKHEQNPDQPWKPWPWVGLMVTDGLVFLLLWYGFTFSDPPVDFFGALRDGDDQTAYDLLTPELQEELGGAGGFEAWAVPLHPKRWFFFSACSTGGRGRIDGTVRFEDGEKYDVTFHERRTDDGWQIQGITFWDMGMDYWVGASSGLDCSD